MESFSTTKMPALKSKRNKSSQRQKPWQQSKEGNKPEPNLKIYAELSRKQYKQILNGELEICVPHGVQTKNKAGSRGLFFECDNKDIVEELINGLEASSISWQED